MKNSKITSIEPLLWGCGFLFGCLVLITVVYCIVVGSILPPNEPGSLGATLRATDEQREAEEKEDAHYESLVQRNFKIHKREFDTLAKQLLASQRNQTHSAVARLSTLQKMQVKEATVQNKAGQRQLEFVVNPKNDFGDPEDSYTYCDALYVYAKKEPVEMTNEWKHHLRLKSNWYFFLREKSGIP